MFELRHEAQLFQTDQGSPRAEFLNNSLWLALLAYLVDAFHQLNEFNISLQGRDMIILFMHDNGSFHLKVWYLVLSRAERKIRNSLAYG